MEEPAVKPQLAWQPFTPRGVAAFANAPFGRLFLVQLIFGALAAVVAAWFLHHSWFPVVDRAIAGLPGEAQVRHQRLSWNSEQPVLLADNRFLAIAVDLRHQGGARSPAHLQLELGEQDVKLMSLLGYVRTLYPAGVRIGLTRTEAEPWWGAWATPILGIAAGATIVALIVCWSLLATLYCVPLWLFAFFANRDLSVAGSWRLGGAALVPGAAVFCIGIALYGCGALDLPLLALVMGLHFLVGWIYAWAGVWARPQVKEARAVEVNPFSATRG